MLTYLVLEMNKMECKWKKEKEEEEKDEKQEEEHRGKLNIKI